MTDVLKYLNDKALAREMLERGVSIRSRAAGPSMQPVIMDGDSIIIEPAAAEDLRKGDIILYLNRGRYVIHRVVKITGAGTLITRGDNVPWNDPPVPAGDVRGRAVAIESRGRGMVLNGRSGRFFARAIAWLAPSRIRGKRIGVRCLGRLCWLLEGRRLT